MKCRNFGDSMHYLTIVVYERVRSYLITTVALKYVCSVACTYTYDSDH